MSLCAGLVASPGKDVASVISVASAASPSKQQRVGWKSVVQGSVFGSSPFSAWVVNKQANGLFPKKSGVAVQFKWACTVTSGVSDSLAALENEEDDNDDWESELFKEFAGPSSKYGSKSEDESTATKEEESLDGWSAKARERAIKVIQERELPLASFLEDGKKKRRKRKKKKIPAPDSRIAKGKPERLEKMTRALGDKGLVTGPDSVQASIENQLLKAAGSGDGLQGLAGLGGYWKSLGNSTAGKITPASENLDNGESNGRGFSNRIVISTTKNVASSSNSKNGPHGYSAPSRQKRQEDFDLNRKLVGAVDETEVLSLVGAVMMDRSWGQDESPLSPFNVATALHRIAKHMEVVSMSKSDRLCFARQKVMAQLVSAAIEALPQCSAQSISNISWALSKVGGYSLYWTEMDLLAKVALTKLSDLQPQHIANIAGALASMQHSIPPLFIGLDRRASFYHCNFQPQELAQLLWAFANLNQPANLLLDSLDSECQTNLQRMEEIIETRDIKNTGGDGEDMLPCYLSDSFLTDQVLVSQEKIGNGLQTMSTPDPDANLEGMIPKNNLSSPWVSAKEYFKNFSLSQLASLSWSYTVLDQLRRPSFALIWHAILDQVSCSQMKDLPWASLQLSQLYQTKLSLQLEYPELGLSLGEPLESLARKEWEVIKSGLKSTSVTQLNVERLLEGMGRHWVTECTATDYSIDAALVEERIGLEIDGPSHFARNTGTPLGHTMLKRRQLAAAGWTVLSIPYLEWDDQLGEQEQRLYLYNLLKNHL